MICFFLFLKNNIRENWIKYLFNSVYFYLIIMNQNSRTNSGRINILNLIKVTAIIVLVSLWISANFLGERKKWYL